METQNKEVKFFIHESEHAVKLANVTPETTLNYYLRNVLNLKGTKSMCSEGGCGSCVVVIERIDPTTNKTTFLAVNSCLVPILSCHGWRIYTVEGIGGPLNGYHPIQEILAKFNGTQCGFCTSGMVMNMYALYENGNLTMKDVENSFGGNLCRCTGYRPILAAFKSLCRDADPKLIGNVDIEDIKLCSKQSCTKTCGLSCKIQPLSLTLGDSNWYLATTVKEIFDIIQSIGDKKYRFVAGNTAQGVYHDNTTADVYIDINNVDVLKMKHITDNKLIIGACTSLTTTMSIFNEIAAANPKFAYLKQLADHIDLVANVPVRNMGTLAGNLMIKHAHNEFQSDIFLILETVGALITVIDGRSVQTELLPKDFINFDMQGRLIYSITLPSLGGNIKYESYKIMGRAQNTHAIVNAGFLFDFKDATTLNSITIVYGAINPTFIHAGNTERFLAGKKLFDNTNLQYAYQILASEIKPEDNPPEPSPEFRQQLAISLFYKAVLGLAPINLVSPKNRSGGSRLERPISKGTQDYETNKSIYPLTEPIPKLEALAQCSGVAEYIVDMPDQPHQLYAAFVLAEATPGSVIVKIDPSAVLALPDIVAFLGKDDIPGDDNFMPPQIFSQAEELFCSGTVLFYHQPIGLVVGKDGRTIEQAASKVHVEYRAPDNQPLLTVRQILNMKANDRITEINTIVPKREGTDTKHIIKGSFDIYQQYHFHLETQCCNVIPNENGLDVYPATQWMDLVQVAIANVLKLPASRINVNVRRCGGAYGAKITRNTSISCATALAAWKLRKPVKFAMSMQTNMRVIGKRFPLTNDYEVAVNDKGVIQYLRTSMYSDLGSHSNEVGMGAIIEHFMSNYDSDTFTIHANTCRTDCYSNTWTRAPSTTEGICAIEAIMDHIAYNIGMDPLDLRIANITKEDKLIKYINDMKTWADIANRKQQIATFNQENRWKKKGISVVPMAYKCNPFGPHNATVSIFHADGTVAISHGGIEIGQGINTKAAQICAYKLGIPLDKVNVVPSQSFISPNNMTTGGSVTSEAICYGVIKACDKLISRIKPIKDKMKANAPWEEVIQKCSQSSIDLKASGRFTSNMADCIPYTIYGVCATEVLIDILTGQHIVSRVDIIEDVGYSMSPFVDIGQVEGAFIMGLGYYTCEQIVYDQNGSLLTNRTWNYTPPGVKDIPVDFRIKFPKGNPNPVGVMNSKATGEPPLCLSVAVPLAIRNAIASARTDANKDKPKWYPFDGPSTVENTFLNSLNNYKQFNL